MYNTHTDGSKVPPGTPPTPNITPQMCIPNLIKNPGIIGDRQTDVYRTGSDSAVLCQHPTSSGFPQRTTFPSPPRYLGPPSTDNQHPAPSVPSPSSGTQHKHTNSAQIRKTTLPARPREPLLRHTFQGQEKTARRAKALLFLCLSFPHLSSRLGLPSTLATQQPTTITVRETESVVHSGIIITFGISPPPGITIVIRIRIPCADQHNKGTPGTPGPGAHQARPGQAKPGTAHTSQPRHYSHPSKEEGPHGWQNHRVIPPPRPGKNPRDKPQGSNPTRRIIRIPTSMLPLGPHHARVTLNGPWLLNQVPPSRPPWGRPGGAWQPTLATTPSPRTGHRLPQHIKPLAPITPCALESPQDQQTPSPTTPPRG